MNLVVDCSFIMSSILPDENQTKIEAIYKQIDQGLYEVYAPSIFYLECHNVLLCSLKRERITTENYSEYLKILSSLPIKIDIFSTTTDSFYPIGNIADKYELSSYDASYLDLAIRMESKLVTFDKKLIRACKKVNVEVLEL